MTANIVIRGGFRQIFYFPFREETLKKAGTLVKANHVRLAEENFSQGGTWIFGKVTRSMSVPADPYAVRFQMDSGTRKYVRGVAGISGLCKNGAAIFHYINSERTDGCTCTDKQQVWKAPS